MKGNLLCPCGCGKQLDPSIRFIAESIEREIEQELNISSGARCSDYNRTIQGSIAGDSHEKGMALDIIVDPNSPEGRMFIMKLICASVRAGIKRMGDGMKLHHFLHIDCDRSLPSPRMWFYT